MSRLYFTPVDKAFTLSSSQNKDTQEEINQITKIILSNKQKTSTVQKEISPVQKEISPQQTNSYQRIGKPDQQTPVFRANNAPQDDLDYNLMKVIGHPRFDDLVKDYILVKHPDWLLFKESVYTANQKNSKSTFVNMYQSTVMSTVQKYIIFFIISVFFFVFLSAVL
jgi:hypothetical protein